MNTSLIFQNNGSEYRLNARERSRAVAIFQRALALLLHPRDREEFCCLAILRACRYNEGFFTSKVEAYFEYLFRPKSARGIWWDYGDDESRIQAFLLAIETLCNPTHL